MPTSPHVTDVDTAAFPRDVVERSSEVPVVVDFWAEWCGPCRTLGPALEAAVDARAGEVVLAKVDVDHNPQLAQAFGIQGIPAVKAFKGGRVVAEFTGAINAAQIERFLDELVPSLADRAVARGTVLAPSDPAGAATAYREALAEEPGHRDAALGLAELLVAEDPQAAADLVRAHRPDPRAEAVLTRVDLAAAGGDLEDLRARVAADPTDDEALLLLGRGQAAEGRHGSALDTLLRAVEVGGDAKEDARAQVVELFNVLGDDDERVRAARPRLARALF